MDNEDVVSPRQLEALLDLGIERARIADVAAGSAVAYLLNAGTLPIVAILQIQGNRLRSGIVEINDPGNGVIALAAFWRLTRAVAETFGSHEIEVFAVEVINSRLAEVLQRHGFERRIEPCPDELGNESMEILTRVFPREEM